MLLGGEKVLLAVSGGIDSMALLDMMVRLAPTLRLELAVAHFDHGLRAEASQEDSAFVVEQAKLRGLKSYVGRGDVKKLATAQKLSVEEASRKARYQFLARVARKHEYAVIATAHNSNDNAETLLLNMMRGSGVTGLAAIPPVRTVAPGVLLARPLLGTDRSTIEAYAAEVELQWREDATNASLQFTRNRVRHELLPLLAQYNPGIINTLNSTAEIMRGLEQYLSHAVELAIKRVVTDRDTEHVEMTLTHLKHYLPAIQAEIVQRTVSKTFDIPPISYSAVERTLSLVYRETGSRVELGGGLSVVRDRDTLTVRCDPPTPIVVDKKFKPGETIKTERVTLASERLERANVRFTRNTNVEFVDADKISDTLTLRSWRDGDRFRPIGLGGEKKVSDFLVDSKVPLDRKKDIMVVADGENIVWVCGMRMDDRYRVEQQTKNVIRLEIRGLSRNGD
ncbi:MAG: Cell cycle control ATPase [Chlorobi bacterium]|nr:Cell cycle control ATPase [Chlorobiota bacterium]